MARGLYPSGISGNLDGNIHNVDGTTVLYNGSDSVPARFTGDLVVINDGAPDTIVLDTSSGVLTGSLSGNVTGATSITTQQLNATTVTLTGVLSSSVGASFSGNVTAQKFLGNINGDVVNDDADVIVDISAAEFKGTADTVANTNDTTDAPGPIKVWVGEEDDLPAVGDRDDDTIYYAYTPAP